MTTEEFAAYTTYVIVATISFLCVCTTVFRTKSVRNQLLGAMLINLAVGYYIVCIYYFACIYSPLLAEKSYLVKRSFVISDIGSLQCYLQLSASYISKIAVNASIIIILFDAAFSFPQTRKAQILVTVVIWAGAVVISVGMLYGIQEAPEWIGESSQCYINLRNSQSFSHWCSHYFIYGVRSIVIVVSVIIFFVSIKNMFISSNVKRVPFFLTATFFMVLESTTQTLYCVSCFELFDTRKAYSSFYVWQYVLCDYGGVLISLFWLILMPDLRNKFLGKNTNEPREVPLQSKHSAILKNDDKEECDNDFNSSTDKRGNLGIKYA